MAKSGSDEIATTSSKSSAGRRFPWRLWLWALAMTAGAGAGGYYAWQYRGQRTDAVDKLGVCSKALTDEQAKTTQLATKQKQLDECAIKLGEEKKKSDGYAALNASQAAAPVGPGADPSQRAELEKRNAAADDLYKLLAKTPNISVGVRHGLLVITLPSDALFAAGGSDLSDTGKVTVTLVGAQLKRYADHRFLITGHTDDAKAPKDNWDLSTARAISVARFLPQAGVDPHTLIAGGAGDGDPTKDATKAHRIEIAMLPSAGELSTLPASLGADTAKADAAPAPAAPTPAPAK